MAEDNGLKEYEIAVDFGGGTEFRRLLVGTENRSGYVSVAIMSAKGHDLKGAEYIMPFYMRPDDAERLSEQLRSQAEQSRRGGE